MGPCPTSDGRWTSYSPRSPRRGGSPSGGKKKKYNNLSHQPGEGFHGISVLKDLLSIGKRL